MGSAPQRAVTQEQVAREAGVSRGLVSMALAGSPRVAQATRDHILGTAARLGYRVNRSAAALASGRSGLIGLVLPDLRNPFFDFIAHALQVAAREQGLTLVITLATQVGDGEGAVDTMLAMQLEGLVLVSPAMPDPVIRALGRETAVCLIGRTSAGGRVDTVRLDEEAAALVVVDHLLGAGTQDLVYLTPPEHEDPNATERGGALVQACREAGVRLHALLAPRDGGGGAGQALARCAQDGRRIGVVAHNDVVALDALAALRAVGGWTPLVSYDDTYLARREEFSLTSVEQPADAMARDAIRLVCERSGRLTLQGRQETGDGVPAGPEAASGPGRSLTLEPVLAVRRSLTRPAGDLAPTLR